MLTLALALGVFAEAPMAAFAEAGTVPFSAESGGSMPDEGDGLPDGGGAAVGGGNTGQDGPDGGDGVNNDPGGSGDDPGLTGEDGKDGPGDGNVPIMPASTLSPVTINVANLGTANQQNAAGQAAWQYLSAYRLLRLESPGGNYTLTGTNSNLSINVSEEAANANITMNNLTIIGSSVYDFAFRSTAPCTITVTGANTITSNTSHGIRFYGPPSNRADTTIKGTGTLKAVKWSANTSHAGIHLINATLRIIDTATVTAETHYGGSAVFRNSASDLLLLGETATFGAYNNTSNDTSFTIGRAETGSCL